MRITPSTVLAALALFFALGGSAVAVRDAVRPQARCAPGAVRGYIVVNGDPAKGMANFPDQFTSAKPIGCRALQLRRRRAPGPPCRARASSRCRFPGNGAQVAMVSAPAAETTVGAVAPGTFRVGLWVPGRQDAVDTPFAVAVF